MVLTRPCHGTGQRIRVDRAGSIRPDLGTNFRFSTRQSDTDTSVDDFAAAARSPSGGRND